MPRLWLIPFCVILALLLGCSGAQIESAHVGPPAAIEGAITRHYERYASEGNCFNPYIDGVTRLIVLEDTPDRLVVRARYFYRDRFHDGGQGHGARGHGYRGFGERTFTLARGSGGVPVVVGMTGA
ncbi:MAG: hypothetical protein ACREJ5_22555 [Geminicoccaceae bacterium]